MTVESRYKYVILTHCGVINLGQHWFRWWLAAWRHQAITWTNVDLSSVRSCGINLWADFQRNAQDIYPWHEFENCKLNITAAAPRVRVGWGLRAMHQWQISYRSSKKASYRAPFRWLIARLQYFKCLSNGDTAVLHDAIDLWVRSLTYVLLLLLVDYNYFITKLEQSLKLKQRWGNYIPQKLWM